MARKTASDNATDKEKSRDKINYNENAKNGKPYWFQVMVNGKRVTKRGFRTFTEAKRAREALSTELHKGEYVDETKIPYDEYLQQWITRRFEAKTINVNTKILYDLYLKNHIGPALGHIKLSSLTSSDVLKFLSMLRKKKLSDAMIKRIYAVIRASLNSAVTLELLSKNVSTRIPDEEKPRIVHKERQIWSNDSIRDLLEKGRYSGHTRYWIAVFLAVMTGMRQGELLGLRWSDIDFEQSQLYVRRSMRKDKIILDKLKNESSKRVIALSPFTMSVLMEHKEIIEKEREVALAKGLDYVGTDHVICTGRGTPAFANKVLNAWNILCREYKPAHEPNITFHDLRHQSASIMLNEREDIRVVSKRLGHSTITTTLKIYSHLLPNAQESAARSIDNAMGFTVAESETTYLQ